MTVDIFAGVDGTGPFSDTDYKEAFKNSHVKTTHDSWNGPKLYKRGPSLEGLGTGPLALDAQRFAEKQWEAHKRSDGGARIFLAGYSRGGASVIRAARNLLARDIPVHQLILFDAVDRSLVFGLDTIPRNVRICSHARRLASAGSREIFSNCGTAAENASYTAYTQTFYDCTHGGVGGTPWDAEETDVDSRGNIIEMGWVAASAAAGGTGPTHVANTFINRYTNTTLAEDEQGARDSIRWMNGQIQAAKAVAGRDTIERRAGFSGGASGSW